ncbi:MAG: SPFH/Band 7/PHB domain protein, partial [Methanothermobacter thermautotrophicus]
RMKRAAILEAEGYKQSEIKRAEGDKQAAILEAEGKAEAIKKVADANKYREIAIAEGQAKAILSVFRAMHEGDPTNDIIALKYLEALEKVADGRATKILLPVEATGILGSIAGISEMLSDPEDKGVSEVETESQPAEKPEKH